MKYPTVSVQKSQNSARFKSRFRQSAVQFCRDSTMHGLKNLVNEIETPVLTKRQKYVKIASIIIWTVTCLLGTIFAIVLMSLVWSRFQSTPTITTVETNNYPIWNLPFPAVTICNNNKVYAPAAEILTERLLKHNLTTARVQAFLHELNKLVTPEIIADTFNDTLDVLAAMNYTMEHLMYDMMEPCSQLMQHCSWLGTVRPCKELFRVATTAEGFCCSFNYKPPLDPEEIDTINDFIDDTTNDPVYRVSGAGQFVGLEAFIQVGTVDYVSYANSYYGVSVLVHGTDDFPQQSDRTAIGQPGDDLTVAIVPTVVVSEASVRGLPLRQRNCYFDDEVDLESAIKYTYKLCIAECAVETIFDYCKCLPFYYPQVHMKSHVGNNRQCTLTDLKCLRSHRNIFASLQPQDVNETIGMDCRHCLPSCSTENYEVHTIIAHRHEDDGLTSTRVAGIMNLTNYVTMRVHFKDISCIKYRRDVILTWDGLLASFGGIFGLCLGGSVISLIEFLYYFTFQMFKANRVDRVNAVKGGGIIQVVATVAGGQKNQEDRADKGNVFIKYSEYLKSTEQNNGGGLIIPYLK